MTIRPIKEKPRLTRGKAMLLLIGVGFTDAEAGQFLDELDRNRRTAIAFAVQQRKKERQK